MTFEDILSKLSRSLSFNSLRTFQDQSDFPGPSRSWNFQEKNPGLSGRCAIPVAMIYQAILHQPQPAKVNNINSR